MSSRTSTLKIGENKGKPRIWIEGHYLEANGFYPGMRVRTEWAEGRVVITPADDGDHTVASRRNRPILDYAGDAISEAFKGAEKIAVCTTFGQIVITPAKSDAKASLRRGTRDGSAGSIFSGGGLLDEAARLAGYKTKFGVEWDPDYAEIWQANHSGHLYQGCISEVDFRKLPQVDLFIGGIPCEPFSRARRQIGNTKRTVGGYVDHDLADMTFWALQVIDACNPRSIVLEEVEDFVTSELGIIAMKVLRRMGYNVESRVISGTDYGALTLRKRAVVVGVTDGPVNWPTPYANVRTLGEILHDTNDRRCEWFHLNDKPWLLRHWENQTEKGNGFISQKLTRDTTSVQAITKRYFAGQGDNPVVCHPTEPDTYRWLTIDEVKAIMGLPEDYFLGEAKTTAGEVMGQGVLVDVFRQIIESVAPRTAAASRIAA